MLCARSLSSRVSPATWSGVVSVVSFCCATRQPRDAQHGRRRPGRPPAATAQHDPCGGGTSRLRRLVGVARPESPACSAGSAPSVSSTGSRPSSSGPLGEMCVGHSRHRTRTAGGARQVRRKRSVDLSGDRETGCPTPRRPDPCRPVPARRGRAAAVRAVGSRPATSGPTPTSDKPPFTIVIPPPNVTGSLHMGHALEHTLHGRADPAQADAGLRGAVAARHGPRRHRHPERGRAAARRARACPGTTSAGRRSSSGSGSGRPSPAARSSARCAASATPSTGTASASPWTRACPAPSRRSSSGCTTTA